MQILLDFRSYIPGRLSNIRSSVTKQIVNSSDMFTRSMRPWARSLCWECRRRFTLGAHRIAGNVLSEYKESSMLRLPEGDRILLRVKDESKTPLFTKPLRPGKTIVSRWGSIGHEALIGRGARDVVMTSTGRELRIHIPSLHDYVKLTPRLVTPVSF